MVVSITAFRDVAAGETLLNSVSGIDAKAAVPATLYTVPGGKTVVVTKVVWRVEAIDTLTVNPAVGIGIAAGEDDIFAPQTMSGFTAVGDTWTFDSAAKAVDASAAEVIKFGFDTFATATTLTLAADIFGYFIGTTLAPSETLPGQVTGPERTAGTEVALRSFSPDDVAVMAGIHGSGGAVGSLIHVETKVLVAAATSVNFTGLNGDIDGLYVLSTEIRQATGSAQSIYLKPNGLAISAAFAVTNVGLNNPYTATVTQGFLIGSTFNTTFASFGEARQWARTGIGRGFIANRTNGSGGYRSHGVWTDTAANITSLLVESSVASNMGIGSRFILYKIVE